MHIQISLNPKQESDRITAFLNQLACYDHDIVFVCSNADLIDRDKPIALENVRIPSHHLSYVDRLIYVDGDAVTELYLRPVNKDGLRRKL